LLTITFIILGIGNSALAGTKEVTNGTIKLGGYFGLATAIVAWYASFAAVLNSTFGRTIAPVVPLARR
jgi:succinate-acetate transporter protein